MAEAKKKQTVIKFGGIDKLIKRKTGLKDLSKAKVSIEKSKIIVEHG